MANFKTTFEFLKLKNLRNYFEICNLSRVIYNSVLYFITLFPSREIQQLY